VPATVAGHPHPFAIAISPDGRSLYVADTESSPGSISQYDVGVGGGLTPKSPATVTTPENPGAIAVSPDGKSVYVTDSGGVSQFDVMPGGMLTPKSPETVPAGGSPAGVAVSPDGRSVYVTNFFSENISQYNVGTGGVLTSKSPATVAAGSSPDKITLTPDGTSAYVSDVNGFEVSQYSIGSGGVLVAKSPPTVHAGHFSEGIAVSPNGKVVYVDDESGSVIERYGIGSGGALSLLSETPTAMEGPVGIAISPDGKSLYATVYYGNVVSQYDVGPGGELSPKSPATTPTEEHPEGIVVSPDQGPLAAFTATPAKAGSASTFDGSASSDPDGSVARYDWVFGDGTSAANAGPRPAHVYASAGTYAVRLTVTDDAGCSTAFVFTGQTAYCNGGPGASETLAISVPPPSTPIIAPTAPLLSSVTQSASRWREGNALAHVTAGRSAKNKLHVGTTFSFMLNETANISFAFTQQVGGRKVKGRCVVQTRRNRHDRACKRTVTQGTLSLTGHGGTNKVSFQGRISTSKKLRLGRYKLVITATNSAGQRSQSKSLIFTIVK